MDDRTWLLVRLVFSAGAIAVFLPAIGVEVPNGFWTLMGAIVAFLGGREVFRKNDKSEDKDGG